MRKKDRTGNPKHFKETKFFPTGITRVGGPNFEQKRLDLLEL